MKKIALSRADPTGSSIVRIQWFDIGQDDKDYRYRRDSVGRCYCVSSHSYLLLHRLIFPNDHYVDGNDIDDLVA